MSRNTFTVGVKMLSDHYFHVVVGPLDTVAALKQRIFEREGVPPPRQNLLVSGRLLQPDTRMLSDYNLKAGDCVYVTAGKRSEGTETAKTVPTAVEPQAQHLYTQVKDLVLEGEAKATGSGNGGSGGTSTASSSQSTGATGIPSTGTGSNNATFVKGSSIPGTDVVNLR